MKKYTRIAKLLLILLLGFFGISVQGQSILNPSDPVVTYNPSSPPASPAWNTIGKWVRTVRVSWNTTNYKCYVYNGSAFRLRFPKSYNPTATDGKKYPMLIFFHGAGEGGPNTDNEYSLFHGGQVFDNAVTNGTFDGYVFVMQTTSGFWGEPQYGYIRDIINYMIANNKLDPFRISINGLSGGGAGTWDFAIGYTNNVAASVPMSAASLDYINTAPANLKYMPTHLIQGGLDGSPDPSTTQQLVDAMNKVGCNLQYTIFPNDGHDTWDDTWNQSWFWPTLNNAYISNPWTLFGRTQFCPGDPINITVGVTQGFQAYQWRKDSVLIQGATGNTINVTQLGKYDCRVQRSDGIWSDWSHTPLVVSIKQPTVPPAITIPALTSNVIPALDTSHGVTLQVPTGYASYVWQKVGSSTTIGTANSLYATTPGSYQVQVTEQFGCSSAFSSPYTVIDAGGTNKPSAAASLTITPLSQTQLRLDWSVNPSQQFPQTGFEVYQATQSGGPYKLIDIVGAGSTNDIATGLNPGGKYYYIVRAVNGSAAAAASNEASGTTLSDVQPPTAPTNLTVTGTTRSSAFISWTASTDNVGVTTYDIYVNGVKTGSSTNTTDTVYGLVYPNTYAIAVVARDFAKNISPFSNQVVAQPLTSGLNYKFIAYSTSPTKLPDFGSIVPTKTGLSTSGPSLSPATQSTKYAFLWEGFLHVTQAGTYQLRVTSVDGAKVWLGPLNGTNTPYSFNGTALLNNDGVHGSSSATSNNITLAVGVYPIAIEYFHGTSGSGSISLSWKTPGSLLFFSSIPNSAFADVAVDNGDAPAAPSGLTAVTQSYNKIQLKWVDNSTDETAYEIWRSTSPSSGFVPVGVAPSGATMFVDTTLSASTKYYYQVRAINQFGQSAFTSTLLEAYWQLNNNYNDSSGNGRTLTAVNGPVFDATTSAEGGFSLKLNGTNQAATIPNTNSFLQTSFSQRTIAGWIRSTSNTNNRVIFDIGGSDNGLALLLNSNTLIAAVASGNSRSSISAAYTNTTGWSHVAVVYNGDSLQLFVNGALVASKYNLSFHSIGTTTNGSRLGQTNGSNAFNTTGSLFSGWLDGFQVYNVALDATGVNGLQSFIFPQSSATTQALPAIPAAPTGLGAQGSSTPSTVTLHWTDNAVNESSYQVYRSSNNNSNYLPLATLPANATSFVDTGLFANAVYYYKVRAVNLGGNSAFSNEDSAHTKDHVPVLTAITAGQFMRYGTTLTLPVQAADLDPEALNVQVSNLPGFGTFTSTGNGTGNIVFTPAQTDQGIFNNITVTVADQHGAVATQSFNLTVNDNFSPVISRPVGNVSMNAKATATVNLSATDQNTTDVLTWTFTGLPAFATPTTNGGNVQLALAPGYADAGVYTVRARVDDGRNGFDSLSFTITVAAVTPPSTKTYIHFSDGSAGTVAGTPWNNTSAVPVQNLSFPNLLDENGAGSGVTLTITTPWQNISLPNGTNTYGVNTGNNSGVYPDAVTSSAYYTDGSNQVFQVSGLDTGTIYNFTFFGSRGGVNDDRTTIYTINAASGTSSVSLQCANNSTNTAAINNVRPNADGTLTITLQKGPSAPYGYINALVIEKKYNDHTVPVQPRNIAGQFVGNSVALTWTAAAYNAAGYQVYRAANAGGPYTLVNPGATDPKQSSYNDSTISENNTYYYYVTASNAYGVSPSSDTLTFTIPNLAPVIAAVAPITVQATKTATVNVSASDPGDVVTLQAIGLPSFISFQDNGNGTGSLTLTPTAANIGIYSGVTLRATDNHGAVSNMPLNITVTFANLRNVYINFNDGSSLEPAQGAPWNNMNSAPNAGASITNLKDDSAASTGFTVSLADTWAGANNVGPVTGNNSGVYPDNVMQSLYYDNNNVARHINIAGLSSKGKYNVIFFAGRAGTSDNRITHYTIGDQSVQLNASSNSSQTVQINNISPDANGKIAITLTPDAGSSFIYINAMQIQYSFDTTFYAPTALTATGTTANQIQLNWVNNTPGTASGFEIWRSLSPAGPFGLLQTVSGTTISYTDGGLLNGSNYFYEVRAIAAGRQSPFSNIAGGSTVASTVYVQFNDGSQNLAQGGFWNSTNTLLFPGFVLPNMINDQSQRTGMNLGQLTEFTGYNVFGTTTGNNSGIYPDNVIQGFFYVNFGDTAKMYVNGLNLTSTYNFNFFGSRVSPTTSVMSTYQIGNQIVTLDATNNTNRTVQIAGVKPDSTGTIVFSLYNTDGGRAYLDALTIDIVPSATSDIAQTPVATQQVHTLGQTGVAASFGSDSTAANLLAGQTKASVFPNPFLDDMNLSLQLPQPVSTLVVSLTDVTGRVLVKQVLSGLPQGTSTQRLSLGENVGAGTYFIVLQGLPDGRTRVLPVVKSVK